MAATGDVLFVVFLASVFFYNFNLCFFGWKCFSLCLFLMLCAVLLKKRHKLFLGIRAFSDVGICVAGEAGKKVQTFGRETVGLLGFVGHSRVGMVNETSLPCRAEVVVYEGVAALLAHTQVGDDLAAWQDLLAEHLY